MNLYFKIKLLFEYIFPLLIIIIIIICGIIYFIKFNIDKKLKKNCFKCKYYNLYNVSSVGDVCIYKCSKLNKNNKHTMNDKYNFVKCKQFENK